MTTTSTADAAQRHDPLPEETDLITLPANPSTEQRSLNIHRLFKPDAVWTSRLPADIIGVDNMVAKITHQTAERVFLLPVA